MSTGTGSVLRGVRDADRWRPERLSLTLSRAVLAVLLVGFGAAHALGVHLPPKAQYAVYLVGMVALNLPHGGYEHFANLRRRGLTFGGRYVAAYLALIAAFVGLLFLAPVIGLALAISVAMVKGGNGGLHVLDATVGTPHLRSRLQRALAVAVRGGAVMAVPIVAWPGTFHTFSAYMVNVFDPGALDPLARYFPVTRPVIAATFALAAATHVGLGFVRARRADADADAGVGIGDEDGASALRAWLVDAGETTLLIAYFAVVPVVVAVGLYFPFWYSVRQLARTTAVDDEPGDGDGLFGVESPQLVALAAWVVLIVGAVATFSLFALVYTLVPNPLGLAPPLAGAVALWSIFISVIALPHVVVGSWYDRDRGIWYVPS